MPYRMLAVDLDGTLLRDDKSISDENRQAIRQAHNCGLVIVLATGRPPVGARHALNRLAPAANEFLIAYNGALTIDLRTGRELAVHELMRSDFDDLAPYLRQQGLYCYAFSRDTCLAPWPHGIIEAEHEINGIDTAVIDFSLMPPDERLVKIMATGSPEELTRVCQSLPDAWRHAYQIVQSAPFLLEFLHPGASKGQAIRALSSSLSISSSEVICIGDASNDTDMITWAGLGVAMGNADDALRSLADHITDTNQNHGIARVIERFILSAKTCPSSDLTR